MFCVLWHIARGACLHRFIRREAIQSASGQSLIHLLYDAVLHSGEDSVHMTGIRCMILRVMSVVRSWWHPSLLEPHGGLGAAVVLPEGLPSAPVLLRLSLRLPTSLDDFRHE